MGTHDLPMMAQTDGRVTAPTLS